MTTIEILGLTLDSTTVVLLAIILPTIALVVLTGWFVYGRGRPVARGLGASVPDKADRVLMIGGSSRFPFVVEQHLPPPKPARAGARATKPESKATDGRARAGSGEVARPRSKTPRSKTRRQKRG